MHHNMRAYICLFACLPIRNLRHCSVINLAISLSILANVHWTVIMLILFSISLSSSLILWVSLCAKNYVLWFFDQSNLKWKMTVINLIALFCPWAKWKTKNLLKKRVHNLCAVIFRIYLPKRRKKPYRLLCVKKEQNRITCVQIVVQ